MEINIPVLNRMIGYRTLWCVDDTVEILIIGDILLFRVKSKDIVEHGSFPYSISLYSYEKEYQKYKCEQREQKLKRIFND